VTGAGRGRAARMDGGYAAAKEHRNSGHEAAAKSQFKTHVIQSTAIRSAYGWISEVTSLLGKLSSDALHEIAITFVEEVKYNETKEIFIGRIVSAMISIWTIITRAACDARNRG
jgi:hypothetical protein